MNLGLFRREIEVLALRVRPSLTQKAVKILDGHLFHRPLLRSVVTDPSQEGRLLLFSEKIKNEDLSELPQETLSKLNDFKDEYEVTKHTIKLTEKNFTANEMLTELLPSNVEIPSSYEVIGHIAHLNLLPEQQEYKHIIAEVIRTKGPQIRTVVNKTDTISNQFRTFPMELLCGDDDMVATVRESGCNFQFNFSEVYWNSRLQAEHGRLLKLFKPGELIWDACAGVGPFAVPAAKKGCFVMANDLNPASYKYLCENAKRNKVREFEAFNLDGREFLKRELLRCGLPLLSPLPSSSSSSSPQGEEPEAGKRKREEEQEKKEEPQEEEKGKDNEKEKGKGKGKQQEKKEKPLLPHHIVMNLPAIAIEFLDVFQQFDVLQLPSLLPSPPPTTSSSSSSPPPSRQMKIHIYCFTTDMEDPKRDALQRASNYFGRDLSDPEWGFSVREVRDVAPSKIMLCVSFNLLKGAFGSGGASGGSAGSFSARKRRRIEKKGEKEEEKGKGEE